jgi:para-nitrobenzyl esterase
MPAAEDLTGKLREIPAARLLAAEIETAWDTASRTVIDGWVVPESARERLQSGAQARIPLLLGSAADEGIGLFPLNENLTVEAFDQRLSRRFGSAANRLRSLYAADLAISPGHAERTINADQFFTLGMREWADLHAATGAPAYLYHMAHVPPAFRLYDPDNPDLRLEGGARVGAYHSGDLAFVFGNTRKVGLHWNEDDHRLSALMADCWVQFAKTGDPGSRITWPRYSTTRRETMVFDKGAHVVQGVRTEKLAALKAGMNL